MKTTIGVLNLLSALTLVGILVVKDLQQITTAAGGAGSVLMTTTETARQQQENRQQLIQMVRNAMRKTQPSVDAN